MYVHVAPFAVQQRQQQWRQQQRQRRRWWRHLYVDVLGVLRAWWGDACSLRQSRLSARKVRAPVLVVHITAVLQRGPGSIKSGSVTPLGGGCHLTQGCSKTNNHTCRP